MAATGITAVKDALVARIDAAWGPPAGSEVSGKGRIDFDAGTLTGRRVVVFRAGRQDAPVTREADQYDYAFAVWVVERYADQGDPPEDWIDERVAWVEWLLTVIGSPRDPAGNPLPGMWPQEAAIEELYDVDDLTEHKVFSSLLRVTYREEVAEA